MPKVCHKHIIDNIKHLLFNLEGQFINIWIFGGVMASDVKFSVKDAVGKQYLSPISVSEELQEKFIKKSRSSSIKLVPVSFVVSAVVLIIIFLLVYFLKFFIISTIALFCIIFPFYAIYNVFATSKAIKNHDYEFLSGEVVGKADSNYAVRGLEEHKIAVLFGRKEYNPGERVIVARLNDELSIISEE
jgi:hypothetical protein